MLPKSESRVGTEQLVPDRAGRERDGKGPSGPAAAGQRIVGLKCDDVVARRRLHSSNRVCSLARMDEVPRDGPDRKAPTLHVHENSSLQNPQPEHVALAVAHSASALPDFDEKDEHFLPSSAFSAAQSAADEPGLPSYTYSPPASRKFDSFLTSLVQDTPDEQTATGDAVAGAFVFQSSNASSASVSAAAAAFEAEYQLPPLVTGYAMSLDEASLGGASHAQLDSTNSMPHSQQHNRSASSNMTSTSLPSDSIASRATASLITRFQNEFDAFQVDFEAEHHKVRSQIDRHGASAVAPPSSDSTKASTLRGLLGNYFAAQYVFRY